MAYDFVVKVREFIGIENLIQAMLSAHGDNGLHTSLLAPSIINIDYYHFLYWVWVSGLNPKVRGSVINAPLKGWILE